MTMWFPLRLNATGITTIEFFTIRVTDDPYSQLVINPRPLDKKKSSNSLSDQELKENLSYVLQLDVNDSEKQDEYKGFLFLTSSYAVDSYHKLLRSVGEQAFLHVFNPEELKSMNSDDSQITHCRF